MRKPRGAVVLAALAAAAFLGLVAASRAARHAAESWASKAVGAPVRVGSVRLGWPGSRLLVLGLEVRNPPGFTDEAALTVERLAVGIDMTSLAAEVLEVEELVVDGLELRVSRVGGVANLDAIEEALVGDLERSGFGRRPRVSIGCLSVRRARARVPVAVLGGVTAPLEDLDYTGIGREEGGLAPPALVAAFFELMRPTLAKGLAHTDYGSLAGGGARSAGRAVGSGAKKAAGKVRGLFKR